MGPLVVRVGARAAMPASECDFPTQQIPISGSTHLHLDLLLGRSPGLGLWRDPLVQVSLDRREPLSLADEEFLVPGSGIQSPIPGHNTITFPTSTPGLWTKLITFYKDSSPPDGFIF